MASDPSMSPPAGWLRGHTSAVIEGEERTWSVRYVVTPDGAALVFPVTPAAVESGSVTLLIPDDARAPGTAEVLAHPEPLADWRTNADADRWQICFGRPAGSAWVRAVIDSGRLDGRVHGAAAWVFPNPLAPWEGGLCKLANADRDCLARAAAARLGVTLHEALLVGVDPWGLHLRHAGGVARATWTQNTQPAAPASEAAARQALHAWLGA